MGKITLNLSIDESKLKEMIQALGKQNMQGNPFYKRSESEIAKMILAQPLEKEYLKYVQKSQN